MSHILNEATSFLTTANGSKQGNWIIAISGDHRTEEVLSEDPMSGFA
jgi:hypothetical protein